MHDKISVRGVLLDNKENQIRNIVQLDSTEDVVNFTTWRPFNTGDPLDVVLAMDSRVPISLASGTVDTEWD